MPACKDLRVDRPFGSKDLAVSVALCHAIMTTPPRTIEELAPERDDFLMGLLTLRAKGA